MEFKNHKSVTSWSGNVVGEVAELNFQKFAAILVTSFGVFEVFSVPFVGLNKASVKSARHPALLLLLLSLCFFVFFYSNLR